MGISPPTNNFTTVVSLGCHLTHEPIIFYTTTCCTSSSSVLEGIIHNSRIRRGAKTGLHCITPPSLARGLAHHKVLSIMNLISNFLILPSFSWLKVVLLIACISSAVNGIEGGGRWKLQSSPFRFGHYEFNRYNVSQA